MQRNVGSEESEAMVQASVRDPISVNAADRSNSRALFEAAAECIPGAVNAPIRSFRNVGGTPRFIASADGCFLTDVDGRRYIDYIGSWGATILGHRDEGFTNALREGLDKGTAYGTPCAGEVTLAEKIVACVPSIEKVRVVNTGTEAVMSAVRLARAVTGRRRLVKFDGCYHGHVDDLMLEASFGRPDAWMQQDCSDDVSSTVSLRYNDVEGVTNFFAEQGTMTAAVIVEPVATNMGVVLPAPRFLETLREATRAAGALLIFDEVVTGFRVSRSGAQGVLGVSPDITILGKALGGGLPIGAFGGPAHLMDWMAPLGPVYQGGTFSGNPLTVTAALATLHRLTPRSYEQLERAGNRLHAGLVRGLTKNGIRAVVQRFGSMVSLFFGVDEVTDYAGARRADHHQYALFFHEMLKRGVHLPASGFEACFVSLAHSDEIIDETIARASRALSSMPRTVENPRA